LDSEQIIEALLFAAGRPVPMGRLAQAAQLSLEDTQAALDRLEAVLAGRGVRLQRFRDTVALVTAPEAAPAVRRFFELEPPPKLSRPLLETLAVVALLQPVTRAEVDRVRGVSSERALAVLVARGLVEVVGWAEGPGRPALYGVTRQFLETFGLESAEAVANRLDPEGMLRRRLRELRTTA